MDEEISKHILAFNLAREEIDETFEKSTAVGVEFPFHKHPLFPTKVSVEACVGCGEVRDDRYPAGGYACDRLRCKKMYVHKSCIEITNPSHPTQPLTLMSTIDTLVPDDASLKCSVCEGLLDLRGDPRWYWPIPGPANLTAHLGINPGMRYGYRYPFSDDLCICRACASKELYINPKKSHDHLLFVLLKGFFSFPCDACGLTNDSSCLCLCIPCRFTIHRDCVNLPRVICINRHDDRISHVPRLSPGEWGCGVCHKTIDWRYGAYSCSTCSFASHSICAIRSDVWDEIELEGVPEDDPKDIEPYKVVEEGLIKHFTHEHNLRLINEDDIGHEKNKQCYACVLPIFTDPRYSCVHCDFILHETCANLPRKKRHMSHRKQFILYYYEEHLFWCRLCRQFCNGFAYMVDDFHIDVRCVLIYDGYVHKSQPDSMLLAPDEDTHKRSRDCTSCGNRQYALSISGHDNLLMCYMCATTPAQVIYKYDDHLLSLQFGENTPGDYWCEICETKMNSHKWFYTCDECCTTVHIDCVLGKQPYLRVGSTFTHRRLDFEVVRNNFASRPRCFYCYPSTPRIVDALVCRSKKGIFLCSNHGK